MPSSVSSSSPSKGSTLQWIVVNTCRLLVSATFVFSGIVKLIDPVGTQYRIEDYAAALGVSQWMPEVLPITLAVAMALVEFCLGISLLFGIRRRLTTTLLLVFLLFYTPLTFWLAQTDAVADCGCFGDAIHLTNWQTFGKNAVLLFMAFLIWWRGNLLTRFISESVQWIISLYSALYGLFIAGVSLYAEPIIDFRPFHIGQNIPAAMQWPEDPMLQPEILEFEVLPVEGLVGDTIPDTETLLSDTSYTFLLVAPYLEFADDGDMNSYNAVYDYASAYGYRFLCLTASRRGAIRRWQDLTGAEYPFAFVDELTLKTMARSNPALLLLHNGTIVGKWSHSLIPDENEWKAPLDVLPLAHPQLESYKRELLRLLLWYVVPLGFLTFIDRSVFSLRWLLRRRRSTKNK